MIFHTIKLIGRSSLGGIAKNLSIGPDPRDLAQSRAWYRLLGTEIDFTAEYLPQGSFFMTWIRTVPLSEAGEKLRHAMESQKAFYPLEYATPVHPTESGGAEIVESHSLIPDALFHAFATFGVLMSPDLPLSRRQHEMITTMVSVTNRCVYWIESHAEFLRRVTLDKELVAALEKDYTTAPIGDQERVMLDYVVKLTRDATKVSKNDHQRLRAVGFDDTAILQITLIASWFNYINRVADALGVGRETVASSTAAD
jgi:uncharacterized peroxidase-related enzyme